MYRVAVVLVDRANYGRMKPVMRALKERGEVELLTVCSGTMLLERFGRARDIVEKDGFSVDSEVYLEVEGSVPITMAKSAGLAVTEFGPQLLFEHMRVVTDQVIGAFEYAPAGTVVLFQLD